MNSLIGKLVDFDPAVETWEQYAERLQHFFDANEIQDDSRKRSIFIVSIDSQELQVTSQFTKSGAAEEQVIYTDCWGAAKAPYAHTLWNRTKI